MSEQNKIEDISGDRDKYETYKVQMGRLSKALDQGFYYEAIVIEYAVLEDRLTAYLYHMGLIEDRKKMVIALPHRQEITDIYYSYETSTKNSKISFKTIAVKINMVRNLMRWSSDSKEDLSKNKYLNTLRKYMQTVNPQEVIDTLNAVDAWRSYRNEIIHSLMTKKVLSVDEELKEQAEKGRDYARILDKDLKALKRRNKLRQAAGFLNQ